ncbi:hypothetical protein CHS0354_016821 [Potamilus streckersoni]|uniref:Mab-21-like HhH/H2TH-like domain-containing protein n=1 Tax=Potamilus streckersoni TaxID=2493646 RepID=A0AAE0T398_9BIVA|nr:hypothetical protein CHS0354_016821 [Potamilus streckersoni]
MANRQATSQDLSQIISKVLSIYWNYNRLYKCKTFARLKDEINAYLWNYTSIQTGSMTEGTNIKGSDSDEMIVLPRILCVKDASHLQHISAGRFSYFRMDLERTRAGFCTLPLLTLDDYHIVHGINFTVGDCIVTIGDVQYLSSERFVNAVVAFHAVTSPWKARGKKDADVYRHGPCATMDLRGIDDRSDHYEEADLAFALECQSWPDPSDEWITRSRLHGWPPKDLMDRIKKMPCHILPVGDPESKNTDLEWRFAFVYQERELLWNFSSTQIQCYILLKALRKVYVNPLFSDEISSYHLKTTIFWLIEDEGVGIWHESNLVHCIVICIEKLKGYLKAEFLPHYFFRTRNLLFNKLRRTDDKRSLLSILTRVQENIVQSLCDVLPLLGSPTLLAEKLKEATPFGMSLSLFAEKIEEAFGLGKICTFLDILFTVQVCSILFTYMLVPNVPIEFFETLHLMFCSLRLDEGILHAVKTFLRLRMAMLLYAKAHETKDESSKLRFLSNAERIYNDASELDGLSGYLYLATFDLVRGEIQLSKTRVLSIFKIDRCMLYVQNLSRKQLIVAANGSLTQNSLETLNDVASTDVCIARDVIFMSTDLKCLPEALKYECAMLGEENQNFNFCEIHPVVYAYFLLVTASQLDENTKDVDSYLDRLDSAVKDTENGINRHTALNLLGFSYYKAGKREEAYNVFSQSLHEFNSTKNAAVYHLCIIVIDFLLNTYQEPIQA